MQRAENVPDAFFRFTLGETSLLRCSRQNRVQRVLAVRVTSPYTTRPTPRSFPFRTAIATDAPNSGDRTANHFAVFCAAAVPRDRQTGSRGIHEVRTYTNFTSFRLSCLRRSKTEKRREFSGQDVQLYNRARTAIRLPPGQGCAPTPPPTPHGPRKIPRTAHRSRTRQTENRGAPRLWRGFRFCD